MAYFFDLPSVKGLFWLCLEARSSAGLFWLECCIFGVMFAGEVVVFDHACFRCTWAHGSLVLRISVQCALTSLTPTSFRRRETYLRIT